MTKLTNAMREHIIESAVKNTNIPEKKAAVSEKTSAIVRKHVVAALPDGFEKAIACLPKNWFATRSSEYIRKEFNPEWIMFGNRKSPYGSSSVAFPEVSCQYNFQGSGVGGKIDTADPKAKSWEVILATEIKAATALYEKETKLRLELSNFLLSCTTVAKVIAKMPELERHFPPTVTKQYPVVASTVKLSSMLDGLGFDVGAKK